MKKVQIIGMPMKYGCFVEGADKSYEYLKESIDRYFQVISDKDYYFDTYWKPEEFFKQKNSLPDFFEEGSKWVNYKNFKEKQKSKNPYKPNEEISRETAYPELNDYNVL